MTKMTPSFLPLYVSRSQDSTYSAEPARIADYVYAYAPSPWRCNANGTEAPQSTGDSQRVRTIDLCDADETDE
jgi:hypothetical protein